MLPEIHTMEKFDFLKLKFTRKQFNSLILVYYAAVMHLKDAGGMTNCVDPYKTAQESLFEVCLHPLLRPYLTQYL